MFPSWIPLLRIQPSNKINLLLNLGEMYHQIIFATSCLEFEICISAGNVVGSPFLSPRKSLSKNCCCQNCLFSKEWFSEVKWYGNGKARNKINFWCMLHTCVRVFQLFVICILASRLEEELDQTAVGFGGVFFNEVKQTKKSGLSSVSSFLIFYISAELMLDFFKITVEFELFTTRSYVLCQVLKGGIGKKKNSRTWCIGPKTSISDSFWKDQHQLWLKRHLLTMTSEEWHSCGKTGVISPHLLFHKLCVWKSDTKKHWGIFIYAKASFSILFCLLSHFHFTFFTEWMHTC